MKRIFLLILLCVSLTAARAQMLAVKSNALMDLACAPNLSLEVATGSHTSIAWNAMGMWDTWYTKWTKMKHSRVLDMTPEFRYWFGGRTFDRFYIGGAFKAVHYSFEYDLDKRRGNGLGGGVTFGYDMYLTRNWVIEFSGGFGALGYWDNHGIKPDKVNGVEVDDAVRKEYYKGDQKERGYALLPFQIGVSVVYVIK